MKEIRNFWLKHVFFLLSQYKTISDLSQQEKLALVDKIASYTAFCDAQIDTNARQVIYDLLQTLIWATNAIYDCVVQRTKVDLNNALECLSSGNGQLQHFYIINGTHYKLAAITLAKFITQMCMQLKIYWPQADDEQTRAFKRTLLGKWCVIKELFK